MKEVSKSTHPRGELRSRAGPGGPRRLAPHRRQLTDTDLDVFIERSLCWSSPNRGLLRLAVTGCAAGTAPEMIRR